MSLGVDYGPGAVTHDRTHVYVGATVDFAGTNLTVGAAWDSINHCDIGGVDTGYIYTVAGYAKYQFTDKASLHLRGEYGKGAGWRCSVEYQVPHSGTAMQERPLTTSR